MVSQIMYGRIKDERLQTWESNHDPYDILERNIEIHRIGGWDFLFQDKLFSDKTQVDWGSFAYKCTKAQLGEMSRNLRCAVPELEEIEDENLGIVFIEQY